MPLLGEDIGLLGALLSSGSKRSSGLGDLLTPGPSPESAFASTLQASPFYQGVPSVSGPFGQIGQALVPMVQAFEARQAAETQEALRQIFVEARMAEERRKVKAAEEAARILADPKAEQARLPPKSKLKIEADGKVLELQGGSDVDVRSAVDQLQKEFPHLIVTGTQMVDGKPVPKLGLPPQAPTTTVLNQILPGNDQFDVQVDTKGGRVIRTDKQSGAVTMTPLADPKAQREAIKRLSNLQTYNNMVSDYETFWKTAKPGDYGIAGSFNQFMSAVGEQTVGVARNVIRRTGFANVPGAFHPKDRAKFQGKWWYKALHDPNWTAEGSEAKSKMDVYRAALIYQGAAAIAGQQGRAISDYDAQQMERLLGDTNVKQDALYGIAALKHLVGEFAAQAVQDMSVTYGPGGELYTGMFTPPDFRVDRQADDLDTAMSKLDAFLDAQSMPKGAIRDQIIASQLKSLGY